MGREDCVNSFLGLRGFEYLGIFSILFSIDYQATTPIPYHYLSIRPIVVIYHCNEGLIINIIRRGGGEATKVEEERESEVLPQQKKGGGGKSFSYPEGREQIVLG